MYTYYSTFGGSAGFGFNLQSDLTTDDDEKRRKINRFLPTTTTIVWYCFSYDGKIPEIIRRIISNDAGNFIELQYFSIKTTSEIISFDFNTKTTTEISISIEEEEAAASAKRSNDEQRTSRHSTEQ